MKSMMRTFFQKNGGRNIGVYGERAQKRAENMGGAAGEPDRGNEVVKRIARVRVQGRRAS